MKFTVAALALQVAAADRTMPANPGAGIVGMKKFQPYENLHKDSFMFADCVQDYMYYHGDKFGNNRHGYKLEQSHNVSIVLYEDHVIKMDRKPMTPTVCFRFCRTVPNMGFFGIVNGRGCYCTPYYQPQPSDNSMCDSPCDGDKAQMCGGKAKSSVYSLHTCADTEKDLMGVRGQAKKLGNSMADDAKMAIGLSDDALNLVNQAKEDFKIAPDPAITFMLNDAAVFSATMHHAAEDVRDAAARLVDLNKQAAEITDFQDPKMVSKAEELIEAFGESLEKGQELQNKLTGIVDPEQNRAGTKITYYPVMYFIDRDYVDVPQTCDGEKLEKPHFVQSEGECAALCDDVSHECAGYQRLGEFCFLFKSFTEATYYAGCRKEKLEKLEIKDEEMIIGGEAGLAPKYQKKAIKQEMDIIGGEAGLHPKYRKKSFLEKSDPPPVKLVAGYEAVCKARFSDYNGVSLTPDSIGHSRGKNSYALKELFKSPKCPF